MAFQDFISGKVSEKAALEAALVRVIKELQAANNAAPAVDDAVNKIKGLISVLQSSPASVVDAAKEAIRDACGDISLLPQNKEVSTLVVPRFVVETNSPVLSDLLGETETESEIKATSTVVIKPQPIEDKPLDSTLQVKIPKRRTQPGFEAKIKEWLDILNGLAKENYEIGIAKVDDEFKYWTNGGKFTSDLINEKLQEAIAYWASLDQPEPEVIIESDVPEDNDVVETDNTDVDLSSFDVEEETTEDIEAKNSDTSEEKLEKIEEERKLAEFKMQSDLWIDRIAGYSIDNADSVQIKIANIDKILSDIAQIENEYRLYADSGWEKEHPTQLESKLKTAKGHWESLKKAISTEENITQKFLNGLNSDNLSEAGLSDLQEEIRTLYGSGHIPQELLDATIVAWERLNNDDDSDNDSVETEVFESESNNDSDAIEEDNESVDIYDGDIPAEEELTDDTNQPTENLENIAQNKIVADNLSWQNSILTNCETWEELKEWDRFIAHAVNKNPDSVLPETFTALDTTRSKLEARDAQQAKTVDVESLTQAWVNRAELAFDLEEIQTIYNEIRESGIVPSMGLIKTLDAAKARLTPVETTQPEISKTDIADAKACINNQWNDAQSEPTIEVQVQSTTTADPFKGRKSNKGQITVEVELTSSEPTQNTSDSITISSINTSGVFEFQTLDGKSEKHHRFDSRYILDPGTKLFEPSTKFVFKVTTWEELIAIRPIATENPNKLPLKSLHNPKRNYGKDADKTDVFVIVSDEQADQFVQEYRATLVQMESDPNPTIGS